MKTIDRILQTIKRDGAVTAKQLAEELGMTTMGARQHLQGLEDDGILAFHDVRVKVGRPTRHWSLTKKGHAQFADRHGELTIQVIDAVESVFGSAGLEKVTLQREQQTLEHYQTALQPCHSLEEKLSMLVELREQEGYMAELESCDDGYLLIENHCPICKAAKRCPSLCKSELNIFQKLLGEQYQVKRTEHIINGERRCTYHIR
ncbi:MULTISPECIES: helix-turn-helix transcriptional regulator [Vibrio]|uniref:Putative transcriptional regulator n=1 Tax=Vibrio proteolyticus NBRC 13287 TaxID=1219065 RepID=U2ZZP3_VIBPR|nr:MULTISPECIES: metalloregulator ArsR/SmtB family transcription factor [Vibrio]NAW59555.1 winged helix-turn-helix transcriptional regulator [Vibrio sp. V36_P2S2PM302]NAX26177.1 winged helix-turn-helix transcriptional regulator [Vibrio sp. V38_P2S17PM301]NAX32859.1 winged helix-turn-helix transcriptional regulator [Vibrio sp. V37_P2S8PM304]GAD66572.1 putative transcriptional regulator [Vibrio proteolyticus NBRC 13287]